MEMRIGKMIMDIVAYISPTLCQIALGGLHPEEHAQKRHCL